METTTTAATEPAWATTRTDNIVGTVYHARISDTVGIERIDFNDEGNAAGVPVVTLDGNALDIDEARKLALDLNRALAVVAAV